MTNDSGDTEAAHHLTTSVAFAASCVEFVVARETASLSDGCSNAKIENRMHAPSLYFAPSAHDHSLFARYLQQQLTQNQNFKEMDASMFKSLRIRPGTTP